MQSSVWLCRFWNLWNDIFLFVYLFVCFSTSNKPPSWDTEELWKDNEDKCTRHWKNQDTSLDERNLIDILTVVQVQITLCLIGTFVASKMVQNAVSSGIWCQFGYDQSGSNSAAFAEKVFRG